LAQGRDDDNVDTVRRRFQVFQEATLPVVEHYGERGKLRRVIKLALRAL
jgi:UMP-CMP kinase